MFCIFVFIIPTIIFLIFEGEQINNIVTCIVKSPKVKIFQKKIVTRFKNFCCHCFLGIFQNKKKLNRCLENINRMLR